MTQLKLSPIRIVGKSTAGFLHRFGNPLLARCSPDHVLDVIVRLLTRFLTLRFFLFKLLGMNKYGQILRTPSPSPPSSDCLVSYERRKEIELKFEKRRSNARQIETG